MTSDLFDYEAAPLGVSVVGTESHDGVDVREIRFDNGSGGEAAAFVARPAGRDGRRRSAVVIAHGGNEGGKHLFVDEALALAGRGIVALAADVTLPREADADEWEEAVGAAIRLQRRALDLLKEEYDARALGFYGHSAGGAQGAILAGMEACLRAVVIAAMGAGVIARDARESLDEEQAPRIARLDPAEWVTRPNPRTLFVQQGRFDETIRLAEARELYELAAPPKLWAEYECGHGVDGDPQAREDRLDFFARMLG